MEVEQTFFARHLITGEQYITDYLKACLLEFGQITSKLK